MVINFEGSKNIRSDILSYFVAISLYTTTETELLFCTSLPHLLLNPCLKGKQTNIKFLSQTKPLSTRAVDVSVKPISRGSSSIDNIA